MWTKTNTVDELIEGVLNHGPDILEFCQSTDPKLQQYLERIQSECLDYPVPDQAFTDKQWFIPKEYQELDIEAWVREKTPPWDPEHTRVEQELELFHKHNMIPVLKTMLYVVETLRANNIVWGVGRGSSVASYVLHIIGVHKIDSIKYNLPIEEFFKGE